MVPGDGQRRWKECNGRSGSVGKLAISNLVDKSGDCDDGGDEGLEKEVDKLKKEI